MTTWNILYRGSLSSCNYSCEYCPFSKTSNSAAELRKDRAELERFVDWVEQQRSRSIGILITPWGEALVHNYYRSAMTKLSHMSHVKRIAIQTNLSAPLSEFEHADKASLALWATFHPSQTTLDSFLNRCVVLNQLGIRYSVGVVGLREHFEIIAELRNALRPEVYLWVNALKRNPGYYEAGEINQLLNLDPYFHWNLKRYQSQGKSCLTGETTFTVDGQGDARRCHFIPEVIGNIYSPDFASSCLKTRLCPAPSCGCHIGYVHRPDLKQSELYGDNILERIPARWPEVDQRFVRERANIS